ncbi:hypothetical protein NDA11_006569 [Ustilago hordei]|nr:hypothetical protein NDA11_006569 [Ustilago hordei]
MVQDKDGHAIGVPTSGDGYPAIAMMIWDDSMPEPSVSLTFTSRMVNATHSYGSCNKADLWHQQLGHANETELDDVVPSSLQLHRRGWGDCHRPRCYCCQSESRPGGDDVRGGGKHLPDLTSTLNGTSLLETPHSDATADMYDDVSMLETPCTESPGPISYTAFTMACSNTLAPTVSNHHLDRMVFVTTVMTGTALIASGQQIHSVDSILLEPLSLNEAKTHNDWYKWQEAMVSEMDSMHKMNIFELVHIPKSSKLISI